MRWVVLAIMVYLITLAQTSLADIFTIHMSAVGPVRPDLLAMLAVYVALYARNGADAMISAWMMGMVIDLTTGAGAEVSTVAGPMPLAYALVAGVIFRLRDTVFRDSMTTQCIMAMAFCALAHWFWVTAQWLLAFKQMSFSRYALMLFQALLAALYTALLMPAAGVVLKRCRGWLIAPASTWRHRR